MPPPQKQVGTGAANATMLGHLVDFGSQTLNNLLRLMALGYRQKRLVEIDDELAHVELEIANLEGKITTYKNRLAASTSRKQPTLSEGGANGGNNSNSSLNRAGVSLSASSYQVNVISLDLDLSAEATVAVADLELISDSDEEGTEPSSQSQIQIPSFEPFVEIEVEEAGTTLPNPLLSEYDPYEATNSGEGEGVLLEVSPTVSLALSGFANHLANANANVNGNGANRFEASDSRVVIIEEGGMVGDRNNATTEALLSSPIGSIVPLGEYSANNNGGGEAVTSNSSPTAKVLDLDMLQHALHNLGVGRSEVSSNESNVVNIGGGRQSSDPSNLTTNRPASPVGITLCFMIGWLCLSQFMGMGGQPVAYASASSSTNISTFKATGAGAQAQVITNTIIPAVVTSTTTSPNNANANSNYMLAVELTITLTTLNNSGSSSVNEALSTAKLLDEISQYQLSLSDDGVALAAKRAEPLRSTAKQSVQLRYLFASFGGENKLALKDKANVRLKLLPIVWDKNLPARGEYLLRGTLSLDPTSPLIVVSSGSANPKPNEAASGGGEQDAGSNGNSNNNSSGQFNFVRGANGETLSMGLPEWSRELVPLLNNAAIIPTSGSASASSQQTLALGRVLSVKKSPTGYLIVGVGLLVPGLIILLHLFQAGWLTLIVSSLLQRDPSPTQSNKNKTDTSRRGKPSSRPSPPASANLVDSVGSGDEMMVNISSGNDDDNDDANPRITLTPTPLGLASNIDGGDATDTDTTAKIELTNLKKSGEADQTHSTNTNTKPNFLTNLLSKFSSRAGANRTRTNSPTTVTTPKAQKSPSPSASLEQFHAEGPTSNSSTAAYEAGAISELDPEAAYQVSPYAGRGTNYNGSSNGEAEEELEYPDYNAPSTAKPAVPTTRLEPPTPSLPLSNDGDTDDDDDDDDSNGDAGDTTNATATTSYYYNNAKTTPSDALVDQTEVGVKTTSTSASATTTTTTATVVNRLPLTSGVNNTNTNNKKMVTKAGGSGKKLNWSLLKSVGEGAAKVQAPSQQGGLDTFIGKFGLTGSGLELKAKSVMEQNAQRWLGADKVSINQQVSLLSLAQNAGTMLSGGRGYSNDESAYMNNGASLDFILTVERAGQPIRLIVVEMDGPWHTLDQKQVRRDIRKDSILKKMGVWLVRATKVEQLEQALTDIAPGLWKRI